jgi:hypothetical protein
MKLTTNIRGLFWLCTYLDVNGTPNAFKVIFYSIEWERERKKERGGRERKEEGERGEKEREREREKESVSIDLPT